MANPIFLIIGMHIGLSRLLEVGLSNAKYDWNGRFCKGYTSADWVDDGKIEEAMAANNNKDDDKKNPQEKNRKLKKEKQCLKQTAARARAYQ